MDSVFLREIQWRAIPEDRSAYPWSLPALQTLDRLPFPRPVTFFAGDNGTGKSTVLEALASACGFNVEGGSRNHQFATAEAPDLFGSHLRLVWNRKVAHGFFFRAESFFEFASQLDAMAAEPGNSPEEVYRPYGNQSLHRRSHGESFLALFTHRLASLSPSLYLFDEPEAALSPVGQMALLRIMHQWEASGRVQVIAASHSPILLSYPGAAIYDFDRHPVSAVRLEDTAAYFVTRSFLDNPQGMLHALFAEE